MLSTYYPLNRSQVFNIFFTEIAGAVRNPGFYFLLKKESKDLHFLFSSGSRSHIRDGFNTIIYSYIMKGGSTPFSKILIYALRLE